MVITCKNRYTHERAMHLVCRLYLLLLLLLSFISSSRSSYSSSCVITTHERARARASTKQIRGKMNCNSIPSYKFHLHFCEFIVFRSTCTKKHATLHHHIGHSMLRSWRLPRRRPPPSPMTADKRKEPWHCAFTLLFTTHILRIACDSYTFVRHISSDQSCVCVLVCPVPACVSVCLGMSCRFLFSHRRITALPSAKSASSLLVVSFCGYTFRFSCIKYCTEEYRCLSCDSQVNFQIYLLNWPGKVDHPLHRTRIIIRYRNNVLRQSKIKFELFKKKKKVHDPHEPSIVSHLSNNWQSLPSEINFLSYLTDSICI